MRRHKLDAARTLLPILWIILIFGSLMAELSLRQDRVSPLGPHRGSDGRLNQPRASPSPAIKHKNSEANSTSTTARGRTVACRASVAVIFSSRITHSKLSLREARPPGAAAGLSQQDQMLIAAAGEVTGARPP